MKFFVAGVPFGCNNIGDEAILAGVVAILRRNFDSPEITVSTALPEETAALLNVNAVPLLNFPESKPLNREERMRAENALAASDVFIWSGATGLSDYPLRGVGLLEKAARYGVKTVLWGVGMDSTLNPSFFTLRGKKLTLCKLFSALTFRSVDFVTLAEKYLETRMRRRIADALSECDLIVVRDPQTSSELMKYPPRKPITIGADSAIIHKNPNLEDLEVLADDVHKALFGVGKKIGICISAQRRLNNIDGMVRLLDELVAEEDRSLFLIPMNPLTDALTMTAIRSRMRNPDRVYLLENCAEPKHIIAAASLCDVVISSRLHLLILAANVGTPIVGISRGSKIDNFLEQFGLSGAGSVSDCDFDKLMEQTLNALENKQSFVERRNAVYANLEERLQKAETLLKQI